MGIPKFFRWLAERYPLANNAAAAEPVDRACDNLYLDLNGIIHPCTHSNSAADDLKRAMDSAAAAAAAAAERDGDGEDGEDGKGGDGGGDSARGMPALAASAFLAASQDTDVGRPAHSVNVPDVCDAIFAYIERVMRVAQPRRLLFLAVDGVAPRAKMNQQRQRRFRTAEDAAEARREMERRGGVPPDSSQVFDSNCITPGTIFMSELSELMCAKIVARKRTDALWRSLEVVFSGQEVPGEGEHKIMDHIRRHQRVWGGGVSHVIHGLDADLIMLSLSSHQPQFSLLREDLLSARARGQQRLKSVLAPPAEFHFLHIGVLREYIEADFAPAFAAAGIPLDVERLIDDFVLLCFFVGNDFLPNLPFFDIAEGSISDTFDAYKRILPQTGGYITDGSRMHYDRLEALTVELATTVERRHSDGILGTDASLLDSDRGAGGGGGRRRMRRSGAGAAGTAGTGAAGTGGTGGATPSADSWRMDELLALAERDADGSDGDELASSSSPSGGEDCGDPSMKANYYAEKLHFAFNDIAARRRMVLSYLEGIEWVWRYYREGVCSWSWFYPYHYAPMVSDFRGLAELAKSIRLERDTPFRPFEQLLAVLPVSSCSLLPGPFRQLMVEASSPIAGAFPEKFQVDMNGKRNAWEGVVLIPFISAQDLRAAATGVPPQRLSANELARNSFGRPLKFAAGTAKPGVPFVPPQAPVEREAAAADGFRLVEGSLVKAATPESMPTLYRLPFTVSLRNIGLDVFGRPSPRESLVVSLGSSGGEGSSSEAVPAAARALVGRPVRVSYPHFRWAFVDRVSTLEGAVCFQPQPPQHAHQQQPQPGQLQWQPFDESAAAEFGRVCERLQKMLLQGTGLMQIGGLDVGEIHCLVHTRRLVGVDCRLDGSHSPRWSTQVEVGPLQCVLVDPGATLPPFVRPALPAAVRLPPALPVIVIGSDFFGSSGTTQGVTSAGRALVRVEAVHEAVPKFGPPLAAAAAAGYVEMYVVSRRLRLSPRCVSMVTGNVFFSPGKHNLGLRLKYSMKDLQVVGYSRKRTLPPRAYGAPPRAVWEFSQRAVDLIVEYNRTFPQVFAVVETGREKDHCFDLADLAPGGTSEDAARVGAAVQAWLAERGVPDMLESVRVGAEVLQREFIARIEEAGAQHLEMRRASARLLPAREFDPAVLLPPSPSLPVEIAAALRPIALGDHVVVVADSAVVSFGTRGTVVALEPGVDSVLCSVVFDERTSGGTSIGGLCSDLRGGVLPARSLLSLSAAAELYVGSQMAAGRVIRARQMQHAAGVPGGPRAAPHPVGARTAPPGARRPPAGAWQNPLHGVAPASPMAAAPSGSFSAAPSPSSAPAPARARRAPSAARVPLLSTAPALARAPAPAHAAPAPVRAPPPALASPLAPVRAAPAPAASVAAAPAPFRTRVPVRAAPPPAPAASASSASAPAFSSPARGPAGPPVLAKEPSAGRRRRPARPRPEAPPRAPDAAPGPAPCGVSPATAAPARTARKEQRSFGPSAAAAAAAPAAPVGAPAAVGRTEMIGLATPRAPSPRCAHPARGIACSVCHARSPSEDAHTQHLRVVHRMHATPIWRRKDRGLAPAQKPAHPAADGIVQTLFDPAECFLALQRAAENAPVGGGVGKPRAEADPPPALSAAGSAAPAGSPPHPSDAPAPPTLSAPDRTVNHPARPRAAAERRRRRPRAEKRQGGGRRAEECVAPAVTMAVPASGV